MKIPSSIQTISKHIIVVSIFIGSELPVALALSTSGTILKFAVFYTFHISFFYLSRYSLLPFLGRIKMKILWLLNIPLILIAYCWVTIGIGCLFHILTIGFPLPKLTTSHFTFPLWRGSYILGLAFIFYYANRSVRKERENGLLEQANLRTQINPHLLFNTLNFVYERTQVVTPKVSEAVLLLSDIMRHSLKAANQSDKSPIASELEQMQRYVHLNQLLDDNNLQIIFEQDIKGNYLETSVPSLLLVNFLENMFKHGNLQNPQFPARINLVTDDHMIHFQTENLKKIGTVRTSDKIGLDNSRKRLENAYGKNFKLEIQEDQNIFKLNLMIRL